MNRAQRRQQQQQSKRAQPQMTFQDMVAQATLSKMSGYIDQQVGLAAARQAQKSQDTLEMLYTRILSMEELIMELNPTITKEDLAYRVATIQDKSLGMTQVPADGVVELGDRVRLEVSTRAKDQTEWQGTSRIMLDDAGSGSTLGKEIEPTLLGMKAGETREVEFGTEKQMLAKVVVNRIARPPKKEKKAAKTAEQKEAEAQAEVEKTETSAAAEGTQDASPNEG